MPKPKPTRTRIARNRFHPYLRPIYSEVHGQYTGNYTANPSVALARDFVAQRRSQFLNHLATGLKAYYNSLPRKSEIEIQVAMINDRYFLISSNKNSTAEHFYSSLVESSVTSLTETIRTYVQEARTRAKTSQATEQFRIRRQITKLRKELDGQRPINELATMSNTIAGLRMAGAMACTRIDAKTTSAQDIKDFCSGARGKTIALVTGPTAHAEQKILYALVRAQVPQNLLVTFGGTFRPCRGCFESLSVVKKYYFNHLVFGDRPGHYWQTTEPCHIKLLKLLRDQGKITKEQFDSDFNDQLALPNLTTTTYRPALFTGPDKQTVNALHFESDSDSDDSGSEDEDYV